MEQSRRENIHGVECPILFNRDRALEIMQRHELDALVSCSIENVFYTSSLAWTPWSIGLSNEWNFVFTVISFQDGMESILIAPKIIDAWPQIMQSSRTWIRDVRYYGENWYESHHSDLNRLEKAFVRKMNRPSTLNPITTLADALTEKRLENGRIAVEKNALNASGDYREFEALQRLLPSATFVEASSIFKTIRLVKSADEIERLEHALRVNENALRVAFGSLKNANEIRSMRVAAKAIIERGGLPLNVSVSRSRKSSRPINRFKQGDLVWSDYLISCQGYCSDVARMASIGEPDRVSRRTCDMLAEALGKVVQLAKPGTRVSDLYNEAISLITERLPYQHGEFGPCLGHGIGICLGNSLGICPHEEPWLVATSNSVLEPGMIVNLEVPYNSLGLGVFNMEETIQITQRGNRRLSRLPRGLHVVE